MNEQQKIVEFDRYCKTCQHKRLGEDEEPCRTCLEQATNTESRVPVKYEKRKG